MFKKGLLCSQKCRKLKMDFFYLNVFVYNFRNIFNTVFRNQRCQQHSAN